MQMSDVDDFDFICHIAYDQKPLTRRERADGVRRRDFLSRYSGAAREVLETLLDSYMNLGIKNIEKIDVLRMKDFQKFGARRKSSSPKSAPRKHGSSKRRKSRRTSPCPPLPTTKSRLIFPRVGSG